MKLSNIWKAWASTTLGVLIGTVATTVVSLNEGSFSWTAFGTSAGIAVLLGLSDGLKELKKEIDNGDKSAN